MTEEEFEEIENAAYGDMRAAVGVRILRLVEEVRRLQKRLEETENLLARATIDEEQFRLGRADGIGVAYRLVREEEDHLGALRDHSSVRGAERGAFDRAHHYVGLLAERLKNAELLPNPLPPEAMRERIQVLEEALKPFADCGKRLNHFVVVGESSPTICPSVCPDNAELRLDDYMQSAIGPGCAVTAGNCRQAYKVLNETQT